MNYDCIVIGGGPAGLEAALIVGRAGFDVAVIGKDQDVSKTTAYADNRSAFAEPRSRSNLIKDKQKQATRLGVTLYDNEVTSAGWGLTGFYVRFDRTTYNTKSIVLATGIPRKKSDVPDIEQFKGKGVSYCAICDARFYKQKRLALIGTGKYALSEASDLVPFAASITILSNGMPFSEPLPRHIPLIDKKIDRILGDEGGKIKRVVFTNGDLVDLDGLFIAEGMASALDLATKLGLGVRDDAIVVDQAGKTNLPGIFACGGCTSGLVQFDKTIGEATAAGISAAAYMKQLA